MILDAENQYSDAQALTATAVSTNVIDHGVDREMGVGEPMEVFISLDVAADDGDADETYVAELQVASDEAFTSPVSVAQVTITAGAVAGSAFRIAIPQSDNFDRFSRLNFTLGGTTPSVTVTAFLRPSQYGSDNEKSYPIGYTVS